MKLVKSSVTLLDVMGSDLSVANAARVSFNKVSQAPHMDYIDIDEINYAVPIVSSGDAKLIGYLADHNHWSPFAHCFLQFRIKMPIFVARQLVKHQVGLAWNEVSRRYVDFEPEFILMPTWRERSKDKKQGSHDHSILELKKAHVIADAAYEHALKSYNDLLALGVCPEQARAVLPLSMMTEVIWSGSLFAFARVCNLRLDPHTQKEARDIAIQISEKANQLFPESWKALVKYVKEEERGTNE